MYNYSERKKSNINWRKGGREMRDPIAKFEIEMEEIGWWTGGGNLN